MLALPPALVALALFAPAQNVAVDDDRIKIQFDEVDGTLVPDFLKLMEIQLGRQVTYEPRDVEDRRLLVLGAQELPRRDFRAYAETLLLTQDLIVVEYGPVLAVRVSTGGRHSAKPGYAKGIAPFVPRDELMADWKGRRQIVTTVLTVRSLHPGEVTNMLQTYFTDPMLESCRSVDNARSLVLTGHAETLRQVARLVDELDRAAAADAARRTDELEARLEFLEERLDALEERDEEEDEEEEKG